MNILTQNNIKTMSSREISELCGKIHAHVLRDIRTMVEQIGNPNMDYEQYQLLTDNIGRTSEVKLGKDLTMTLITGYSANIRYQVIKRWQELEANASQPVTPALPNFANPADAAIAWAEQYKAKEVAEAQVIELQPKAEALARISQSIGATNIRDTAKAVGMRQNEFVAWCIDDSKSIGRRFMYRDDKGVLNAYSHRTSAGLMTQKLQSFVGHDGRDRAEPRVKFTPAGVAKIAEMLEKERSREAELV